MDTYTLEAGRAIRRNGAPFISIAGCARDLPGYAPVDFDTFARFIPAAIAAIRICRITLARLAEEAGDVPEWNRGGTGYEAAKVIRHALALLPKQEG